MRNLGEYPVTDQEIIDCLTELRDDLERNARGVGDLRPTLIDAAIERTTEHPRPADRIGVNKPFARGAEAQDPASSRWFAAIPARLRTWLTEERQ